MSVTVICIVPNHEVSFGIVSSLKSSGIAQGRISVRQGEKTGSNQDQKSKNGTGAESSAGTSGGSAAGSAAPVKQGQTGKAAGADASDDNSTSGSTMASSQNKPRSATTTQGAGKQEMASRGEQGPEKSSASGPNRETPSGKVGADAGSSSSMTSMGIPENEAKRIEGKMKTGCCLICVRAKDKEEATVVAGIFKSMNATDISTGIDVADTEEDAAMDTKQSSSGSQSGKVEVKPGNQGTNKPNIYAEQHKQDKITVQDKPAAEEEKSKPHSPTNR